MYRALSASVRGMPNGDRLIIPPARAVISQTLVTIELFRIVLVDLTPHIVNAQCGNEELQLRGIRAADALHVSTALAEGADILISTDRDLIDLDAVFTSAAGNRLRCVDTDTAVALL